MVALIGLALLAAPLAGQRVDSVVVTLGDDGSGRAGYYLSAPTREIRFTRPAAFYRERAWRVTTPGYQLTRDGDWQLLQTDGPPANRIDVSFPVFAEPLPKEYEFYLRFTDGGVALYTGHLTARVGDEEAMPPLILVPPAGRHAVVRGDVIDGPARVQNGDPRGTYVYVGRARPVATAEVIAVVDPGMPRWLVEWLEAGLPRVMHRYGQLTGLAPRTRPTVLYTYHDDGSPGRSAGGGTLPGLITIALTGDGWGTPTDAARAEAFQLLAHEAFHLWNGERVTNAPAPTGAWIHEGSADVFATGASLHLGALDSASARGAQEAALNRCAMALARGSVESALARGQPRMVYDCGQVMAWWTGLALRSLNGGRSLDTFWRDLLAAGLAAGGEYDAALYIGLLARQGAGPATITAMQAFLTGSGTDSIAVAALQALGAPIVVHADPPTGVDQGALVAEAFAHLMQAACGRASFYGGAPIRTVPVSGCSGFARERHIARIAELPVGSAGAAIHDAVAARCAANGEVSIEEVDGSREAIPCTRPLQRRPPWYEVRALIEP